VRLFRLKKTIIIICVFWISADAKVNSATLSNNIVSWSIPQKKLPLPLCASKEIQKVLAGVKQPNIENRRTFSPKTNEEWRSWIEYSKISGEETAKAWSKKYDVKIRKKNISGVNTYYITSSSEGKKKDKHLFVYLHGGAYIFGGGMSGLSEAILIANRAKIPVLAIDYRLPPDHPYPAAINDVISIYKSLVTSYPSISIAIGGSSSGGGLTLATVHKLKSLHLPLPAALFVGTPWSDLKKCGDSLYVNEGIDRKIVTYDGFLPAAAKLYANGADLSDPELSPVYGDFSNFPPTMLVSGTRDLFLSMTVRVHRKMKAAGVTADLNVYEGLSHVEYFVVPDSPESIEVYSELKKFLKQHLQ